MVSRETVDCPVWVNTMRMSLGSAMTRLLRTYSVLSVVKVLTPQRASLWARSAATTELLPQPKTKTVRASRSMPMA